MQFVLNLMRGMVVLFFELQLCDHVKTRADICIKYHSIQSLHRMIVYFNYIYACNCALTLTSLIGDQY